VGFLGVPGGSTIQAAQYRLKELSAQQLATFSWAFAKAGRTQVRNGWLGIGHPKKSGGHGLLMMDFMGLSWFIVFFFGVGV